MYRHDDKSSRQSGIISKSQILIESVNALLNEYLAAVSLNIPFCINFLIYMIFVFIYLLF